MLKLPRIPNLTELAYQSVKRHLLDGSLTDGARLTEESIASQLGISKSPVREALNRLESEGLVCIEARRGAFVRRFSLRETKDLYELREVLELHAIGTARITPALLRDLEASVNRTRRNLEEDDKLAHVEEDMRFHGLIAAATQNDELFRILENVQHKSLLTRSKTYHLSAATAPLMHQTIYEALQREDREGAQAAMREHIRYVRDTLVEFLETGQVSPVGPVQVEWEPALVGRG